MRMPSPLRIEAVYIGYLDALQLGAQAGINLLETCIAQRRDLGGYPMNISNGFNVAYFALTVGRLHFRYINPEQSYPSCLDVERLLESVSVSLDATTGQLSKHYSMIRQQIESERSRLDSFYNCSFRAFTDDDLEAMFRTPPIEQPPAFFNPFDIDGLLAGGEMPWEWTTNFVGQAPTMFE